MTGQCIMPLCTVYISYHTLKEKVDGLISVSLLKTD